ncbi:hypothetical protein FOZ60_003328 [Perkinsus olseni]|uniref:Integrase catalytic domain-containing protein n=1 Tax=Perkinsus olseni TaxID=32597 RepID=A0A7J6NVS1_PEROL|nr:hypothetical protein FOZ60_003328 [Perkinsus olseni]
MHPLPSMAEICHQQSIDRNIKQAVSLLTQDGKELIPASIPAVFRLVWSTLLGHVKSAIYSNFDYGGLKEVSKRLHHRVRGIRLLQMFYLSLRLLVRELSSKSSRNIAEALKSMNSTLGPFKVLKTDRGLEFRGEVDKYIKKIGAVHSISLPYSPVAVIEQLNKTLLQKLQGAFYSPLWSSQSFGSIVDDILWGLRSTPTTVHHMEPFSIMFGRSPHHDRVQDSRQRAQVHENLQDLLSERRSKAMLKANSPITLTPGTVVFVRNHDLDRKYKVGKRWSLMTVLRQEGVKVYLADYGSSPSTSRVLERHVRECLPTPPGFLDKTKEIVLEHSATRSRHGVLPSTRSTSVSQRSSVAKFKVPVRYSLRVKGKTPNASAASQSHHAAPQADTTSDTNVRRSRVSGRTIRKPVRFGF